MDDQKENVRNVYLEQVQAQQQRLEADLKVKRAAPAQAQVLMGGGAARAAAATVERPGAAVDVRVTGWFLWQTVVVPPNAYVVHTRRDRAEPLHLGLGISFKYNPYTDSFLVVPSTMQTILINAYCICKELQGLVVQGYVQWIIADFATAYKKLDFSDSSDPMRVVNVQLREQAEAAIKDKVATMGIDEVLSDKQPIIEELTARLRHVAEGAGNTDKGLGLRIVTVQIKEAVVSSTRLWENLQKSFRADRARFARLAELKAEAEVKAREVEQEDQLATLRAGKEAETFTRESAERSRRAKLDAEAAIAQADRDARMTEAKAELERVKLEKDAALQRTRVQEEGARKDLEAQAELATLQRRHDVANRQREIDLKHQAECQRILNDVSAAHVQGKLIDALPGIAQSLPKPDELRSVAIGSAAGAHDGQALTTLVSQLAGILDAFRGKEAKKGDAGGS